MTPADALALNPVLSEPMIEEALRRARGDLFVAAAMLGNISVRRLDSAIRISDRLTSVYASIGAVKALPEYDRLSQEQIDRAITHRLSMYRADALDALHDLATMPVTENSAQNQVKLSAAMRLAGAQETRAPANDIAATLAALNDEYHRAAPRIKSVRERVIEFEQPGQVLEARE